MLDKINKIIDAMSDDVYIKKDEFTRMAFTDGYSQGYNEAQIENADSLHRQMDAIVTKACQWLEDALNGDNIEGCRDGEKLINEFKKEMEALG